MSKRTLVVHQDKDRLIRDGARRFTAALNELLAERARVDVALSGGSAAQPLGHVADQPDASGIDWTRVHFWFSDERFVPADHPDRNALEARRLLLDRLVESGALPSSNIHEMPADATGAGDVEQAARDYEEELLRELGPEPAIDLMILGMGPDGHYASLFPASSGHHEVDVTDRLAVGVTDSPKPPPLRVSMTAPLIARSRRTWFFVSGANKADALAHVLAAGDGRPADPEYPASYADGVEECLWLMDADAANGSH